MKEEKQSIDTGKWEREVEINTQKLGAWIRWCTRGAKGLSRVTLSCTCVTSCQCLLRSLGSWGRWCLEMKWMNTKTNFVWSAPNSGARHSVDIFWIKKWLYECINDVPICKNKVDIDSIGQLFSISGIKSSTLRAFDRLLSKSVSTRIVVSWCPINKFAISEQEKKNAENMRNLYLVFYWLLLFDVDIE